MKKMYFTMMIVAVLSLGLVGCKKEEPATAGYGVPEATTEQKNAMNEKMNDAQKKADEAQKKANEHMDKAQDKAKEIKK
ncbi:hypothetical protein [Poriferisphaera sp. WC338]|uniref:hypothetical protein n=1 Tax=Poriferisphaera sp. WC338 TaxID=3425129 RepID=UPI003D815F23